MCQLRFGLRQHTKGPDGRQSEILSYAPLEKGIPVDHALQPMLESWRMPSPPTGAGVPETVRHNGRPMVAARSTRRHPSPGLALSPAPSSGLGFSRGGRTEAGRVRIAPFLAGGPPLSRGPPCVDRPERLRAEPDLSRAFRGQTANPVGCVAATAQPPRVDSSLQSEGSSSRPPDFSTLVLLFPLGQRRTREPSKALPPLSDSTESPGFRIGEGSGENSEICGL